MESMQQAVNEGAAGEARYWRCLDELSLMTCIWDAEGGCVFVNRAWLDYTGQLPAAVAGDGWLQAVHPEDRLLAARTHAGQASVTASTLHYRLQHQGGGYRWVTETCRPRHNSAGDYLGLAGTLTESHLTDNENIRLVESEDRLRFALQSAELGTWDMNLSSGALEWDDRCRALFGLSPSARVDYDTFLKGVHEDDRERVDALVQAAFDPRGGGTYEAEFRTVGFEDSVVRWIAARGKAYFNEGRPYRFIGTVLDIGRRKLAEAGLHESEERLREALLVASTGTWKIDLESGIDTRDAALNKLLGLEAKETRVPIGDSFTRIHPDDVQRMKEALDRAVNTGSEYNEECRIFHPDGNMRWIKDRGQVVCNERGEPRYIIGAAIDITEQKEKEEALKISEEKFRSLFDNAAVGIAIMSLNGRFLQTNDGLQRIFGYSEEEMLQRDFQSLTHPDYLTGSIENVQNTILGRQDRFTEEKKYLRSDGSVIWGQVTASLVKDLDNNPKHFIAIITNIHDKKLAEESLKLQARILESMDEGVSVCDEQGIILYTNAAEDKMFGYESGELIGQHVTVQNAYVPEENERIVGEVMTELGSTGYWNGEWHNRRKDGSTFFTYSHITTLELQDRRMIVCVQRDITEEKETREQLRRSAGELERRVAERTRELKEANEQLERSNAELEQFAYVTSHDLQEPLRKIKTFAYRIQDELPPSGESKVGQYLGKVIASSDRMSTLIRDLLNYSRLTKQQQEPEEVSLDAILQEVLSDFELLITQKGAVITADALPKVQGIPLQLTQLFFNLIGNGLKFSRPGQPPRLAITCRELSPEEAAAEGLPGRAFYAISFRDEGIGFHPRYQEQIFEIFQRLHSRDEFAGTGIGLALSKRVAENHQGAIRARSAEGQGATFTVFLPVW
jgi:PAS domain S-box-containing protein